MKIDPLSEALFIDVNSSTLIAEIRYSGSDGKVVNDLKLLLSSISTNVKIQSQNFFLPWHELKNYLVPISFIVKENNLSLDFNDLGFRLVKEYLDDRKSFDSRASNENVIDIHPTIANADFTRTLKDEQIRDAGHLLKLKHGANFSVPGAGKTTTILAVHSVLLHTHIVDTLFVICPINAFVSWEEEIKSVYRSPKKVIRLTAGLLNNFNDVIQSTPDVILVNYEKLRRENSDLLSFFLSKKVHLVIDESHRIKSGVNNLSYSLISKLADLSKRRDVLSGTPMPQSYLDLRPQFDLLWPGKDIVPELSIDEDFNKVDIVNNAIKGLYVRTTKTELRLKDPKITYTKIKLGSLQNELYSLFKSEAARILSGMPRVDLQNFRSIGKSVVRLIQAATNPMLLGLNDDFYEDTLPAPENSNVWDILGEFVKYEKPKKIEYLQKRVKQILSENKDNKVIIWTYFVRNIQLLERLFQEYNPVSIYGAVSTGSDEDETKREGRIKKFHQDSTCRLMIANPQACGEGISLHKICHYAIYLDRNFNAAHFLQSIDRIHRLGLSPDIDTNVEILIAEGTIDEILIDRLNEKILAMGEILDDTYLKTLAYDPADIPLGDNGIDNKDLEKIKEHLLSS